MSASSMFNRRTTQSENSSHHHFRKNAEPGRNAFAGISGTETEASSFIRLDHEPQALARVGVKLAGGLFSDSIYLMGTEKEVAPILEQAEKVFFGLGFGSTRSVFRVSAADVEILVVGENVRSEADRVSFLSMFAERMQPIYDNSNLLRKLAGMPGDEFNEAWFRRGVRPAQEHLPVLRSVMALAATLDKSNARLTVDQEPVVFPDCQSWKAKKWGGELGEIVGTLSGLNSHPGRVDVIIERSAKVSLRASDDGYITQLNHKMRVGDRVRFSYAPVVDLLQPFQAYPSQGRLISMGLA